MNLSVLPAPSDPNASWADVIASSFENSGTNPYAVWTEALAQAESDTIGPAENGEHTSNCPNPAHEDTKPSLRWRQAPDGQILFSCRANCEPQVILDSLGLNYKMLRWSRTEYIYRSYLREVVGIHVKTPAPNGKKKYWWEHLENNQQLNGRSSTWEDVLWLLPDLAEAASHAHEASLKLHLVISEGEKDCISIADAFANNWVSSDEQSGWTHLVTTSGDGAASWSLLLTEQVLALNPAQVTIVCDADQAGQSRGEILLKALREASPNLSVRALNWLGQAGVKDASDAIALYGKNWLNRAIPTAEADIYLWSSTDTGWLAEGDALDIDGNSTGKRVVHRTLNPGTPRTRQEAISKWPIRVSALTQDIEGKPLGWEIDMGAAGPALLKTSDLDGSNLERWNSQVGLFIVPVRGLTASIRAYLGFHGQNVSAMTVYDHEGWIDSEHFVTRQGLLIGPEGESATAQLNGSDKDSTSDWYYGLGDETEAVNSVIQILSFRDARESGPVLAWLTAMAVRPKALKASGASFVPILQVPGSSGIGKTTFLKLATRLFGFSGNALNNVTSAGLVRTLALTTGVVWIDDFTDYDDAIRDIIRGGITGAGRTRGTTSSERGIVRDEAYAALINSGEHAFDANERAMSQRSCILEFTRNVQGRPSRIHPGRDQYPELEDLGVARDDKGAGLSRYAGTIIRGLWKAAGEVDASLTGRGTNNGVRGQASWEFVRYGAHVLAQWLRNMGQDEERVAKLEKVIVDLCTEQAESAARREKSGVDIFLIQEIVPRYLHFTRRHMDSAVIGLIDSLNPEHIRIGIRDAWANSYGHGPGMAEMPARAVVILYQKPPGYDPTTDGQFDTHDTPPLAVAVCAEVLYQWTSSSDGQRSGVGKDERHISATGIAMQLKQVTDKSLGEDDSGTIRVRLGRLTTAPRYRIITEEEVIRWLAE